MFFWSTKRLSKLNDSLWVSMTKFSTFVILGQSLSTLSLPLTVRNCVCTIQKRGRAISLRVYFLLFCFVNDFVENKCE